MKLCVFDFDSTLIDGETIDFLASAYGAGREVAAITQEAMEGGLDFFEALNRRVAMLKGMEVSRVKEICECLPMMNGAVECVATLKRKGLIVVILSGGFHDATDYVGKTLGVDATFANILHQKNGVLTGLVGGEMLFGNSKGAMLRRIQGLLKITPEETIAIGDGANDRAMFAHSGVSIAFCAKEILKREASAIVDTPDLRAVLPYIG
ncbi:phosphoserine phosphatase SerB [Campylobacterota bacterium]|nr:phosphoserine phosphatase SerB [Campylobacterota bacterium]GHV05433.1 phosphoserine phosphatase SerB [Campylobacterota bacterium]